MLEEKESREEEILSGLEVREEQAILWLLEDYGNLMKSVIYYQLRGFPKEEKEECLNQVLFEVWEQYYSFRPEKGSFEAWLATICKNKSIDLMRKLWKSREEVSIEEAASRIPAICAPFSDVTSETLEEILSRLKSKEQTLIREYYLDGFTIQEIADRHQMKPAAVYKRIERSMKKMRTKSSNIQENRRETV